MNYQWNWHVFLQPTAAGDDIYLGWMLSGLQMTLMLSLSAWLIALLLGAVMGVLRTVPNKALSGLATAYVELFRNIPLLVQLFIWYFVLPELLPTSIGDAYKQSHPVFQQFLAAMVCL
ncbi:MAG TPA: ABC transporter permease subunit, partial [Azonexus sp.]|nr:ABC transporter permease subunit [Azonexus sp.]